MAVLASLIVVAGLVVPGCDKATDKERVAALASRAKRQRDTGDLRGALRTAQSAVQLVPSSWRSWWLLGTVRYARDEYIQSEAAFTTSINFAEGRAEPHYGLGGALYGQQRLRQALEECQLATQLAPGVPEYHHTVGQIRAEMGANTEAARAHRKATGLAPSVAKYHASLASTLIDLGAEAEALEEAQQAVYLAPEDPLCHGTMGVVLYKMDRLPHAVSAFRKAIERGAEATYRGYLGIALCEMGKPSEGMAESEEAVASEPASPAARYALGYVLAYNHELARATEQMRQVVRLDPAKTYGYFAMADVNALAGACKDGIKAIALGMELGTASNDHLPTLAYCHARLRNVQAARTCLAQARATLDGKRVPISALYLGGKAHALLGDTARAAELFRNAVKRFPEHPWAPDMRAFAARQGQM